MNNIYYIHTPEKLMEIVENNDLPRKNLETMQLESLWGGGYVVT